MTLKEYLQSGPFTLALSSGFFGFFAHCGVALALEEAGIEPTRFTGASAGAIVAAAWAHDLSPKDMKPILRDLKKLDFWDPGVGLGLLKGAKLEAMMRAMIGTRPRTRGLSISVFNILTRRTEALGTGDIPRLVRASVAVPLMFHPVRIGLRLYWDGGILDKMAVHDTLPNERVLIHYLDRRDLQAVYERNRDLGSMTAYRNALVLKGLPAAGPNALAKGLDAIEMAYELTHRALESEHAPLMTLGR